MRYRLRMSLLLTLKYVQWLIQGFKQVYNLELTCCWLVPQPGVEGSLMFGYCSAVASLCLLFISGYNELDTCCAVR